MQLRVVDYFLAVAEEGSMRAAAQRLGVTQPALTKAVQRLEDETGFTLLERGPRGVVLTVYGAALLRHVRNLKACLSDASLELEALRLGISGRVRVGAGPFWDYALLPRALRAFLTGRPRVQVQVVGGMDESLKAQLRAGALDFVLAAVSDAPPLEADLEGRVLLGDDYRVMASPDHPLRVRHRLVLADLLAFPWVLPAPGNYLAERLRVIFRAEGLAPPEPAIECDIRRLRFAMVRDGDYLSFQAAGEVADLEGGRIVPLDVPGTTWRRRAGIITRRGVQPSPAARALIETIARQAKAPAS